MFIDNDRYINPLTDFGFKKLFGTEPNKALLIDFLNQILPDRTIEDLSYASGEHQGWTALDRKAIFDLYCIGDKGERFIVEMQKAKQNYFKDRSVFYASFPIQEQGRRREWNYQLDPVYSVGILDFIFDDHKEDPEMLHVVELKDQYCNVFYDKLKFVYLELPKFKKSYDALETRFDKWLYVLTHLAQLQDRPQKLQERIFAQLFEAAEIAQFSPVEREAYEDSLKHYRDIKNIVDTAEEKGLQEGMEKGLQEGMEKGLQEGMEKGALNKALDIARQLKQQGFPLEQIKTLTGLSKTEIEAL